MVVKSLEMNSRVVAFTAVMVALANVLAAVSIGLTRVGQVGLDFSNIAVFVAAIYGGPYLGFLVGLLGGIVSGVNFGPLGGLGWLGLIGLPLGKSLTGLTTGLLYKVFNATQRPKRSLLTIPLVLLGYVPEFLFTIFFFIALVPYFLGPVPWLTTTLLISILAKAWLEILLMSTLMGALIGNVGFTTFVTNILSSRKARRLLNDC
jgi:LytS/YehU family sensor histidine kinase